MDRDELKIKIRDAIWNLDSQATLTGHWEDPLTYADAALSAIEEAGYVLKAKEPTTKSDGAHSVSVCPCPSCIAYRNSKIQGASNG